MSREKTVKSLRPNLTDIAAMRASMLPLYHSLGGILRGKIRTGEWCVGDRIPTERELMELFGVSRATVRHAIESLVREGILRRTPGRGTFVAPPKMDAGLLDLYETLRRNGGSPSVQLLGAETVSAPPGARQALRLAPGEMAHCLRFLILVDGEPMMIQNCYLPEQRFPDLLEVYDGAMDPRKFVHNQYGVLITQDYDVFEPVMLESEEAALLGVRRGFLALWLEQVCFDATGTPVEFRSVVVRGDRCRFYSKARALDTLSSPRTA